MGATDNPPTTFSGNLSFSAGVNITQYLPLDGYKAVYDSYRTGTDSVTCGGSRQTAVAAKSYSFPVVIGGGGETQIMSLDPAPNSK